jgi:hypothetical protein
MFQSYDILTRHRAWLWRAALLIVLVAHLVGIGTEFYGREELSARLAAKTWTLERDLYSGVAEGRAPLLIAIHKPFASRETAPTIALRVLTMLWSLATLIVFHMLAVRLIGRRGAAASSLCFALLMVGWPLTMGVAASGPLFGALPALLGLLVTLRGLEERREPLRFMVPGALFGIALLFDGSWLLALILCLILALQPQGRERRGGLPWRMIGVIAGTVVLTAVVMLATVPLIAWNDLFVTGKALRALSHDGPVLLEALNRMGRLAAGTLLGPLPWILAAIGGWGLLRLRVMIPSGEPASLRPAGLRLLLFVWLVWGLWVFFAGHPDGGASVHFFIPPMALLAGLGLLRLTGGRMLRPNSPFDMKVLNWSVLILAAWSCAVYLGWAGYRSLYGKRDEVRKSALRVAADVERQAEKGRTVLLWTDDPLLPWLVDREPATRFLTTGVLVRDPGYPSGEEAPKGLNLLRDAFLGDLERMEQEGRLPAVILDATPIPEPDEPRRVVHFPRSAGPELERFFRGRYARAVTTAEGYPILKPLDDIESAYMPEFEGEK